MPHQFDAVRSVPLRVYENGDQRVQGKGDEMDVIAFIEFLIIVSVVKGVIGFLIYFWLAHKIRKDLAGMIVFLLYTITPWLTGVFQRRYYRKAWKASSMVVRKRYWRNCWGHTHLAL